MVAGTAARAVDTHDPSIRSKEHGTESSIGAPLQRKKRVLRPLPVDQDQIIHSAEISEWKANYLENMSDAIASQALRKSAATARKNAEYLVMEVGIGGIGAGTGTRKVKSPLSIFSGPAFIEALRGPTSMIPQKRSREDDNGYDAEDEGRNVRGQDLELGRGGDYILQDDDAAMVLGDEVGWLTLDL